MTTTMTTASPTAEHIGVASTMTLEDLRREAWRLWDCEPAGPQPRRERLRIELVDLQLELERASLHIASTLGSQDELSPHAAELLRLRSHWRPDEEVVTFAEEIAA